MILTHEDLARFAASARSSGVTPSEAVEVARAIASVPLPPHLDAMLRTAVEACKPGWWRTPRGWAARWRLARWRAGMRGRG